MSKPAAREDVTELLSAGVACFEQNRLAEAEKLYRQAAAASQHDFRPIYSLALIDIRRGAWESAREKLLAVIKQQPGLHAAQQNLGLVCQSLNRWPEAALAFELAHRLNPAAIESHFSLARALAVLGRLPQAIECYRDLSANPAVRLRALTRQSTLDAASIDAAQLADLAHSAQDPGTAANTRIEVYFALAQVLEQRGDDAGAFAAFGQGNRLKHQALAAAPDAAVHPDKVERAAERAVQFVIERYHRAFLERPANRGSSSRAPIFIVGMPRSGSSLVEQILGGHARVQGMGENSVLAQVLEQGFAAAEESGVWRSLSVDYLAAMRKRGWDGEAHFIDKTLENYLHVGALHLMFPKAVILETVRDPMDTCLSCYRQLFASGNETLYDLAQIGRTYVRYRRVMQHWRDMLPGRVIQVKHEELIAEPETQIRWLVEKACGLSWDSACLDYQNAPGDVRSASAAQVRPPLFHTSKIRLKRLEGELQPLGEAFGWFRPAAPPLK